MTEFLQYVISGLSTGSIYALVALGLALIYRSTRILNFAHGDITTAILALVFGSLLAMGFYFCVLVPAQRREATHLGQIILTLGLGLILQGLITHFGGTEPQSFPFPLSDTEIYQLGGVVISQLGLGTLGIGLRHV
jgi:branched-chain amino acid transport system permease protein